MIEQHRACFEYDWRARFHLPLSVVGRSMSYGEAIRLTEQLMRQPDSQVAAGAAGWDFPASRESLVLMDLFDLQHTSKSKRKPKAYPRPWQTQRRTFGKSSVTPAQLRAIFESERS